MKRTLASATLAILAATALILLYPASAKSDDDQEAGPTQEQLHATAVAKAIDATEGRCVSGQSGEQGCFQYLPATWQAYSKEVTGEVLPQTADNERLVTEGMILKWKAMGKSDRWIFLMWNQGNGDGWGPGTKDCYAGTNKWGVHYDSCDYAKRALEYLRSEEAT